MAVAPCPFPSGRAPSASLFRVDREKIPMTIDQVVALTIWDEMNMHDGRIKVAELCMSSCIFNTKVRYLLG